MKKPTLPEPDAAAMAHCNRVRTHLEELVGRSGPLRFDRYWDEVMYAPGLGYYAAGATKFGAAGDFVTAPGLGPVFARCTARQLAQAMRAGGDDEILELGAGTGAFAADALRELAALECLPKHYRILERSADLVEKQVRKVESEVPHLADRVSWTDRLPQRFRGVIFGNEVADAIAPRRVQWSDGRWSELHVACNHGRLAWHAVPLPAELERAVRSIEAVWTEQPEGAYRTEIQSGLEPWVEGLSAALERGLILLIDYGYPRIEYYHPQRVDGTLICHYRHRAHSDPFLYPGLNDLSVSVDFSALAVAAERAGLRVAGFTNQTYFLAACGLDAILEEAQALPAPRRLERVGEIKRLTLPHEMGERFKVFAAAKDLDEPLIGFSVDNRPGTL